MSSAVQHPAYGLLRPVTDTASVLLCNNPGLLTLDGTNTWVLRGRGQRRDGDRRPRARGRRAHRQDRRTRQDPVGADQPQARRPHRRHRQDRRAHRGGGPRGRQRVSAWPRRSVDRRRGHRRRRAADHGDGDTRSHRRLAVLRPRRRGADRRHRARSGHDGDRLRGRRARRLPGVAASGCRVSAAGRCCPGTAPISTTSRP